MMRTLRGQEMMDVVQYFELAILQAKESTCERRSCGAVIVKDSRIVGSGYNSPPGDLESQRRCGIEKSSYNPKVTDLTCCIHAEIRALMDAGEAARGAVMYFTSVDGAGEMIHSGEPYCTGCSKQALDAGIEEWVLWHPRGITAYSAEEYNDISFKFCG